MKAIILLFVTLLITEVPAQTKITSFEVPTTNSSAVVRQRVAATDIEVRYNRPCVKGRKIFGELVPYGQVWRTGSDAATRISFSTPVTLNGTAVDSGSYEIFTIPGADEWVVIIHENRSQWGSYSYDASHDVARMAVKSLKLDDKVETFTISLDEITTHSARLNISWENTRVPLEIDIDIRKTVLPRLEAALLKEGRRPYFRAAMFYFENDLDIERAAELMNLAVEENPTHIGMLYRLALILERKGDPEGAKKAAQRSLAAASSASSELRGEYTRLNSQLLDRLNNL